MQLRMLLIITIVVLYANEERLAKNWPNLHVKESMSILGF